MLQNKLDILKETQRVAANFDIENMPLDEEERENVRTIIAGEQTLDDIKAKLYSQGFIPKPQIQQAEDQNSLDTLSRCGGALQDMFFEQLLYTNKLGLTTEIALHDAERKFSSAVQASLVLAPVNGNFDFEHLKTIHKLLFGDIYYFAGQLRTFGMLLSDKLVFCEPHRIRSTAKNIFDALAADSFLQGLSRTQFIEKFARLLNDINRLHPFREGNGRSKRVFLTQLAEYSGWRFDYQNVSGKHWIAADNAAFVKQDFAPLINCLNLSVEPC